jgi:hypothetical protein
LPRLRQRAHGGEELATGHRPTLDGGEFRAVARNLMFSGGSCDLPRLRASAQQRAQVGGTLALGHLHPLLIPGAERGVILIEPDGTRVTETPASGIVVGADDRGRKLGTAFTEMEGWMRIHDGSPCDRPVRL